MDQRLPDLKGIAKMLKTNSEQRETTRVDTSHQSPLGGSIPSRMGAKCSKNGIRKTNIDDVTISLLAKYNPVPPSLRSSGTRSEEQSAAKTDCIHFKFSHEGKMRRFAYPRDEADIVGSLKGRVQKVIGEKNILLFWQDDDSLVVLECGEDMCAAVDFAERRTKPPCIVIEATVEKEEEISIQETNDVAVETEKEEAIEEKKEEVATPTTVSKDESRAAFNDFVFLCDECECFLAPSNGGRYKCVVCDNYDLCAACVAKGIHDNHALIRLLNGETIVPLADGKGGSTNVQVMDTPRCTPSFVVVQNYDKPTMLIDLNAKKTELENRGMIVAQQKNDNWEKVKQTWEKQKASDQKRRKERESEEMKLNGKKDEVPVLIARQEGVEKDADVLQKAQAKARRERNLQNAIRCPYEKMAEEDRQAWNIILKEEREKELRELMIMREKQREEEEKEERRKVEARMRREKGREEMRRLEKEKTRIDKELVEWKQIMEQEWPVEKDDVVEDKNREHNDLWNAYESWKEKANEEKMQGETAEKVSEGTKKDEQKEEQRLQQTETTGKEKNIDNAVIIDKLVEESDSVLETMQVLENKFDKLQVAEAAVTSSAPANPAATAAAAEPEPAAQKQFTWVAEAKPEVDACSSCKKNEKDGQWPSDQWRAHKEGQPATKKFLDDRSDFLERLVEIERIPAHLERLLLSQIPESPDVLLKQLAQFYCLVSNNIRMHVFFDHEKVLSDNKEVENEMIRLIATDVAKRLMTMLMKVGYAKVEARMRMIWGRIIELENLIGNEFAINMDCRFSAIQLRPILCNNTYTISYEPHDVGFESAHARARDFIVQLNMQAKIRLGDFEAEQPEKPEDPNALTDFQQNLLSQLFETGIFQDYDKMLEVCRTAMNLEQAIEKMLEDDNDNDNNITAFHI